MLSAECCVVEAGRWAGWRGSWSGLGQCVRPGRHSVDSAFRRGDIRLGRHSVGQALGQGRSTPGGRTTVARCFNTWKNRPHPNFPARGADDRPNTFRSCALRGSPSALRAVGGYWDLHYQGMNSLATNARPPGGVSARAAAPRGDFSVQGAVSKLDADQGGLAKLDADQGAMAKHGANGPDWPSRLIAVRRHAERSRLITAPTLPLGHRNRSHLLSCSALTSRTPLTAQ